MWLIFGLLFIQETASQTPICHGSLVLYQYLHFTDRNFNLHVTGLLHLSFLGTLLAYVSNHPTHHNRYNDSLFLLHFPFYALRFSCYSINEQKHIIRQNHNNIKTPQLPHVLGLNGLQKLEQPVGLNLQKSLYYKSHTDEFMTVLLDNGDNNMIKQLLYANVYSMMMGQ